MLTVEGTGDEATVYLAQTATGQIIALNGETGQVVWTFPATPERRVGLLRGCTAAPATDGPFVSPPAYTQEALYVSSAGEQQRRLFSAGENQAGLRALNKLGTLQWDAKVSTDRSIASPAIDDTTAYLPSSDYSVYAIDLETRQVRWSFATQNWVWATPLVTEDRVYIASMDHSLYAVDKGNGSQIWQFTGEPGALAASPVISDDTSPLLYFGSLGGRVYAVRAETGDVEWEAEVEGGIWSSPLLIQDESNGLNVLYVGTLDGFLYAFNAQDGTKKWEKSLSSEIRGTPAHAAGNVYIGCENGRLYAFDAETGSEKLSPLGQQANEASLFASPVYDGQYLYVVANDGRVFALDPAENDIVWQVNPLEQAGEDK
jgi:outer membrane protein assembly factor BamB